MQLQTDVPAKRRHVGVNRSEILTLPTFIRAEGAMRTMTVEKLLKGMPILQSQIDALLDFEVSHTQILESFLSPFYPF